MTQIYRSDAFEAAHSSAESLYRTGVIDMATMRDFDARCLVGTTDIQRPGNAIIQQKLAMTALVAAIKAKK